jgi:hypothetical protein
LLVFAGVPRYSVIQAIYLSCQISLGENLLGSSLFQIAIQLSAKDNYYGAASLIHPAHFDLEDADSALAPLLLIPAEDDADLVCVLSTI